MTTRRRHLLLLFFVWLVLYLPNLGERHLTGTDEPKYAEVAREAMLESHWFALHFNGKPYYGEPPLYFWLETLFSFPQGDVTEFTAMLPSCLLALGTIFVTYFLGSKLLSAREGMLAALMLATMPQFYTFSYMARLDVPFAFFVTACLTCFYLGFRSLGERNYNSSASATKNTPYFLLGWALMGLASITKKGPLAFLLIMSIIVLWKRREISILRRARPIQGVLILALIISGWLLPACLLEGTTYLQGLFGQFESHVKTPWAIDKFLFYLSEVFVGAVPWSLPLPLVFYWYFKGNPRCKSELEFPLIWVFVIFSTFSIILLKFSRYILPLYPAVALLLANFWEGYIQRPPLRGWTFTKKMFIWAPALFLGPFFAWIFFGVHTHKLDLSFLIGMMGAGLISLSFVAWKIFRDKQWEALFVFTFLLTASFQMAYNRFQFPWENEMRSEKAYCEELKRLMEPGAPWAVYKAFRPAQVYYTKSHPKAIYSEEELVSFLEGGRGTLQRVPTEKVYCLLTEEDYNVLTSKGRLPLFRVAEIPGLHKKRFVLACNRSP
ncbi:MAG TPA: ArnT family glycosyltransferase [Candidatus Hypogeohydataceae bacterium YC41]